MASFHGIGFGNLIEYWQEIPKTDCSLRSKYSENWPLLQLRASWALEGLRGQSPIDHWVSLKFCKLDAIDPKASEMFTPEAA